MSSDTASPARAIEQTPAEVAAEVLHPIVALAETTTPEVRACLVATCRIGQMALARMWKGAPHPDYGAAGKSVELAARLLGVLERERLDLDAVIREYERRNGGKLRAVK